MKTFVEYQFNYCPLNRMFHSIRQNNKINDVHKKALRIVYSDYKATFQKVLDKDASLSVPHRIMQAFAMEIHKHILGLLPTIIGKVFKTNRTLPRNPGTYNMFSNWVLQTVKNGIFFFNLQKLMIFVCFAMNISSINNICNLL